MQLIPSQWVLEHALESLSLYALQPCYLLLFQVMISSKSLLPMCWFLSKIWKHLHKEHQFSISSRLISATKAHFLPAKASWRPLISTDWPMFPTSIEAICRGVFLNSSLGGANISWERKNFSGGVIGGKKPAEKNISFLFSLRYSHSRDFVPAYWNTTW